MTPITIPVAELKPALAGFGKVIPKRIPLTVLGYVRVERTAEHHIKLTATDLDHSATFTLDQREQGDPAAILLPLEDLANAAKSCGRGDCLTLAKIEEDQAAIRFTVGGQQLEHRCESLPVSEFPPIDEVSGAATALDGRVRQAVHHALACASTDTTRLILNGAFLDVSKPGGHHVVGTDGRHLFSANSFSLPLSTSLLVPSHPFLGWKGFNEDGDWRLQVKPATKEQPAVFALASDHWRFVSRSEEGEYPNWRVVVPGGDNLTGMVRFAPDSLGGLIATITRLPDHDETYHTIGLDVEARRVNLLAKAAAEQPWTSIEVPDAQWTGNPMRTFINRQLLLKALRFGLTNVDLIDNVSPLRFHDGGRQMIVMPIRPDVATRPTSNNRPPAPVAAANPNPPPQPAEQPKEETTMPETNGTTGAKRATTTTTSKEPKSALELALAQLETVRGEFRNALSGVNKLGDLLKQTLREQKASEKEISSVRQTIRQIQAVRL